MELQLILAITELLAKYGIPATLQIMNDWNIENPTLVDIESLKNRVPKPETYFEE